jgi:hypothetical protein
VDEWLCARYREAVSRARIEMAVIELLIKPLN